MTNRERLARMSDEELASELCELFKCDDCPMNCICEVMDNGFAKWLKQEEAVAE